MQQIVDNWIVGRRKRGVALNHQRNNQRRCHRRIPFSSYRQATEEGSDAWQTVADGQQHREAKEAFVFLAPQGALPSSGLPRAKAISPFRPPTFEPH